MEGRELLAPDLAPRIMLELEMGLLCPDGLHFTGLEGREEEPWVSME